MAIKVKRIKSGKFEPSTNDISTNKTLVDQQIGFERASGNLKIYDYGNPNAADGIVDVIKNIKGNAATATKLAAARSLKVNLASITAVTFDGSANQDSIPVTGILPITQGGTSATSASAALTALGAASLASPTFTGTPKAPTATAGTNTTQIATTAFVQTAVSLALDQSVQVSQNGSTLTITIA